MKSLTAAVGARRRLGDAEDGFTLIEILATALIVVLISAGIFEGLLGSTHLSALQRARGQADGLAQQDQERMRSLTGKELAGLDQTQNVNLDGTTFTVNSRAKFLNTSGNSSCATSGAPGTGAVAYYGITSTVSWSTVANQPMSVTAHSIVAPPAGGTLLAQVNDQTGAPLLGVNVTASGPDTDSGATDSNGCIVLTGLPTGGYSVVLSDPGFVDRDGNTTIADTANVTSSGTAFPSTNPEVMGQAGAVTANFQARGAGGALLPNPQQANALSWFGSGPSRAMSAAKNVSAATPQTSLTAANLFPFVSSSSPVSYRKNYTVWAGKCLQQETPTGSNQFDVTPGSTQTATVQEPALAVFVTYNGVSVAPDHVRLSFTSTSGSSCTDSWYAAVASTPSPTNGVLASPGQPFASNVSSGGLASASRLTGTLAVCADYRGVEMTRTGLTNNNMASATSVSLPLTSTSPVGTC